jgi:50S ribosomal protein L16 3-hydroxylase
MTRLPSPPSLLGGLSISDFFRDYWHKRPLLVRGAIPGFAGLLSAAELRALAGRERVESRIIRQGRGGWKLADGPFTTAAFDALPTRDWTLLVQSVDHHLPAAAALLEQFSFLPRARLDDLMISYAAPGGGVGPHFDAYDVFLLQGPGQRRWRISAQQDLELIDGLPLKILARFVPQDEYVLEPGDMLYLPPHYAHDGAAVGECMTYSIGFRAPTWEEVTDGFLDFLRDEADLEGRYADPDLRPSAHSAELPDTLLEKFRTALERLRWDDALIADFAGRYFSEPRHNVVFEPPKRPLGAATFARKISTHGLRLDARTRFLFQDTRFYINGEDLGASGTERAQLIALADQRHLPAGDYDDALTALFLDWYRAGWLYPDASAP